MSEAHPKQSPARTRWVHPCCIQSKLTPATVKHNSPIPLWTTVGKEKTQKQENKRAGIAGTHARMNLLPPSTQRSACEMAVTSALFFCHSLTDWKQGSVGVVRCVVASCVCARRYETSSAGCESASLFLTMVEKGKLYILFFTLKNAKWFDKNFIVCRDETVSLIICSVFFYR